MSVPNLPLLLARLRARQYVDPLYESGSPLDVGVRSIGEAGGIIGDAASSVADAYQSGERAAIAAPARALQWLTKAPPSEIPGATKVAETRTIPPAVARARMRQQQGAETTDTAQPAPVPAPEDAAGQDQAPPTSFLRYRTGGGGWKDYANEAPTPPPNPVASPGLIAGSFRGEDMPRWMGTGGGLRSAAQMEQDIEARNLLDQSYGDAPTDYDIEQADRAMKLINARRLAAQAQREEVAAAREAEDPYGIQQHVARKLAEFQAARQDPQEQRRAAADTRREQDAQRLETLRRRLVEGGATPEEMESSIRSFVMRSAMEEAQRSGNFGPLAQLLGQPGG